MIRPWCYSIRGFSLPIRLSCLARSSIDGIVETTTGQAERAAHVNRNDSPSASAPPPLQDRHPAIQQALTDDPVVGSSWLRRPPDHIRELKNRGSLRWGPMALSGWKLMPPGPNHRPLKMTNRIEDLHPVELLILAVLLVAEALVLIAVPLIALVLTLTGWRGSAAQPPAAAPPAPLAAGRPAPPTSEQPWLTPFWQELERPPG